RGRDCVRTRGGLDGAGVPGAPAGLTATARGAHRAQRGGPVPPLLALSFVLARVAAASGAGMYLAWPRRMTAEEWVMHRREASKGHSAAGPGRVSGPLGRQARWSLLRPMLGRT